MNYTGESLSSFGSFDSPDKTHVKKDKGTKDSKDKGLWKEIMKIFIL